MPKSQGQSFAVPINAKRDALGWHCQTSLELVLWLPRAPTIAVSRAVIPTTK
jgi:hypothetical protein